MYWFVDDFLGSAVVRTSFLLSLVARVDRIITVAIVSAVNIPYASGFILKVQYLVYMLQYMIFER